MEPLTSSYDVSMTWTRADVDMLAWLLSWIDDVSRADVALADVDVLAWLLTWNDDVIR